MSAARGPRGVSPRRRAAAERARGAIRVLEASATALLNPGLTDRDVESFAKYVDSFWLAWNGERDSMRDLARMQAIDLVCAAALRVAEGDTPKDVARQAHETFVARWPERDNLDASLLEDAVRAWASANGKPGGPASVWASLAVLVGSEKPEALRKRWERWNRDRKARGGGSKATLVRHLK